MRVRRAGLHRGYDGQPVAKGAAQDAKAAQLQRLGVARIRARGTVEDHPLGFRRNDQRHLQIRHLARTGGQGAGQGQVAEELRLDIDRAFGVREGL